MYAEVNSAESIRSPLEYNELKLEAKQAIFLDARNFWQEKGDLSLRDKQQRFNDLAKLNERSQKQILHASVNFHPYDQLTDKEMKVIAKEFLKAIGFGDQPALVYRHIDAGHPHMHIVSTNIRPDGSRISNDLRSPHSLMNICSKIEQAHRLTPALAPHREIFFPDREVRALTYGAIPTRTGIERVLDYVSENCRFTSFESYNAILSLYNVRADRGSPDGIMYHNRGLYYRIIDKEGKKLGAPIKASDFHKQVTLDAVEERSRLNQRLITEELREAMRISIDYHLINVQNLGKFRNGMARARLGVVIPAFKQRPSRSQTETDKPGMFYVDFKGKPAIFRDTELGKDYTAESIIKRCGLDKSIPELARQQRLELKIGEQALLGDLDLNNAHTRDLLLRLSVQQDRIVEKQQEQQVQTHRLRHHL